jgi:hypothetical protein
MLHLYDMELHPLYISSVYLVLGDVSINSISNWLSFFLSSVVKVFIIFVNLLLMAYYGVGDIVRIFVNAVDEICYYYCHCNLSCFKI